MRRVVILQEYIPKYRVPFFMLLHKEAQKKGIEIEVISGRANAKQSQRKDEGYLPFVKEIAQKEWNIFGKRIVYRNVYQVSAGSDLVIFEQARRNIDAYALLLGSRNQSVAFWGHGRDFVKKSNFFEAFLLRTLTKKASWFFAYTQKSRRAVEEIGFPPSRITVLENSIDITALKRELQSISQIEISKFKKLFGLRNKTALFIGGLDSSKRIKFLIEAAILAFAKEPDFRLLLIGDGEDAQLIKEASELYTFIIPLGSKFGVEKSIAIRSVEVIAMPGRVGLVAVDSFAAQTPIVTTNWEWHAPEFEYLVSGRNSVITSNTIESYSDGLVDVLRDKPELERLRANCLVDSEKYTIEAMVENFLDGLIKAIGTKA